jgi:branched-chain amino acid transport system substrate-binding protein
MKRPRPIHRSGTLLAIACVLSAAGCGSASSSTAASTPIQVGILLPLTGDAAPYGQDDLAGDQLALKIFNEAGGVNGRKVSFVVSDVTTPDQAQTEAQRLISQQHIHILSGTTFSSLAIPASAMADRLGALYWETVGASDKISSRGLKNVFQLNGHASLYANAEADWLASAGASALGKPSAGLRVGVTYSNDAVGQAFGPAVIAQAKADGMNVVYQQSYDATSTDLSSMILGLRNANVDAYIASTVGPADATLIAKEARQQNFDPPLFLSYSGYDNPDTAKALGACVNGIITTTTPVYSSINPSGLTSQGMQLVGKYADQYKQITGRDPSNDSDLAFGGMWVLLNDVLKPVGSDQNVSKLDAEARGLDLPLGSLVNGYGVKFDTNQANTLAYAGVLQYQGGALKLIFPTKLAIAQPTLIPRPSWNTVCSG